MPTEDQSYEDAFKSGVNKVVHDIPYDSDLKKMSFIELSIELATSKKDSPRFTVLEREIKKHIAKDQAEINLKNVIIGGIMAGLFGLSGVVIGWWLRDSSSMKQPTSSGSEYQIQHGKLGEMTSTANIPAIKAVSSQPIAEPYKVENNVQPGQNHP